MEEWTSTLGRAGDALEALLAVLESRGAALQLLADDASITVQLCYASDWGQGGLSIEHGDLVRLASWPLNLAIELTFPPPSVAA
jgi:hypothetical protein